MANVSNTGNFKLTSISNWPFIYISHLNGTSNYMAEKEQFVDVIFYFALNCNWYC